MMIEPFEAPFEISEPTNATIENMEDHANAVPATMQTGIDPAVLLEYRVRAIHATLAIEGNTLSIDQVRDIIDDMRVSGTAKRTNEV